MTIITMPWPPAALTPHAKGSPWPKIRATKAYRREAGWLAKEAGVRRDPSAVLTVTLHPPDRARRDCHNMPGRLKAAIDGIADAMGCDDVGFRVRFPESFSEVRRGGAVVINVTHEG